MSRCVLRAALAPRGALAQCWVKAEEILKTPGAAEQRRTAMRLFAVMRDNPLFFFMPTEIPIGTLTTHDWSRTIATLRGLQHRCVRSLSEFVLPAFLDERASTDAVLAILRATDESGAWGAAAPGAVVGGLDSMVPEALLTAMHDPSSGSRLAAAPGDSEAGLWLRMVRDVLADTRGIGAAAVLDATGACVGGDANKYATRLSTSPDLADALRGAAPAAPLARLAADGRQLLLVQPIFDRAGAPVFTLVFVLEVGGGLGSSFDKVAELLVGVPCTLDGAPAPLGTAEQLLKAAATFLRDLSAVGDRNAAAAAAAAHASAESRAMSNASSEVPPPLRGGSASPRAGATGLSPRSGSGSPARGGGARPRRRGMSPSTARRAAAAKYANRSGARSTRGSRSSAITSRWAAGPRTRARHGRSRRATTRRWSCER